MPKLQSLPLLNVATMHSKITSELVQHPLYICVKPRKILKKQISFYIQEIELVFELCEILDVHTLLK